MSALKREGGQALRYLAAGAFGNLLIYLIYLAMTLGMGVAPNPGFFLACLVVMPISFVISRNWTFRSDALPVRAFAIFVWGYCGSYFIQASALWAGTSFTSIPHAYIVPMAQSGAIVFFFGLQRLVIFNGKTAD